MSGVSIEHNVKAYDKRSLAKAIKHSDYSKRRVLGAKRVIGIDYESIDDMLKVLKQATEDYRWSARKENSYSMGWTKSKIINIPTRAKQLEIIRRGYSTKKIFEHYQKLKKKLHANPDNLERLGSIGLDCRRKRRADLAGCIVNIDKAMAGLDPMESLRRQNQSQSVRIFIDLARLADVNPEHILESSCYAIAVANTLEEKGYATEIKFGTTNYNYSLSGCGKHNTKGNCIVRTSFVAKRPDEPVNEAKLLTFSSVGIFRDFIFDTRSTILKQSGMGSSLYAIVRPSEEEDFYREFAECDVYVGHNSDLDTIITGIEGQLSK